MILERFNSMLLHDKTAPVVTTSAAIVAFPVALVALLSTAKDGSGIAEYSIVMLNTSTLFQNAVKVNTSNNPVAARDSPQVLVDIPAPLPTAFIEDRQLNLPSPSQISSFFNSVGSALVPSPTSTSTSFGASAPHNFLQDLKSFFNVLVGGIAGAAGDTFVTVINTLVKDVTDAVGIQDWYALYLAGYCAGNYTSGNGLNTTNCTSYDDIHIKARNSTLAIGTTTLDFSALNLPAKLSKSGGQIHTLLTTIKPLHIVGIVSCGILIIMSPLSLLSSLLNNFPTHLMIASLAALVSSCFIIIGFLATGVQVIVSGLINQLGDGLGMEAYGGGRLLALVWISWVLMGLATGLWFVRWHSHRYVRRGKELENKGKERPVVKTAESTFVCDS